VAVAAVAPVLLVQVAKPIVVVAVVVAGKLETPFNL
jgi:hypothetical protein